MNRYYKFKNISDQKWLDILIKSISNPIIDGVTFPTFPDDQLQVNTVGSANEHALREASFFYQEIKKYSADHAIAFNDNTRILDFGCGWGRHYRFFLKDVSENNLVGTDLDEKFLQVCRDTIPSGNFHQNDAFPPMKFPDNYFDLVYAFSVFSHLNKNIGLDWINEFSRLLKPGGLIIVTTHSKAFIDFCENLRQKPQKSTWHKYLAEKGFLDNDAAHRDYEEGEFLYAPTGGGGPRSADFYGEAIISSKYVADNWTHNVDFIDFVDDGSRLSQAMIVLKKK